MNEMSRCSNMQELKTGVVVVAWRLLVSGCLTKYEKYLVPLNALPEIQGVVIHHNAQHNLTSYETRYHAVVLVNKENHFMIGLVPDTAHTNSDLMLIHGCSIPLEVALKCTHTFPESVTKGNPTENIGCVCVEIKPQGCGKDYTVCQATASTISLEHVLAVFSSKNANLRMMTSCADVVRRFIDVFSDTASAVGIYLIRDLFGEPITAAEPHRALLRRATLAKCYADIARQSSGL
eukprot:PhF_6_TR20307/c0_g1_i1/m.29309